MTSIYQTTIVIKPYDPEAFRSAEGQRNAEDLIAQMEAVDILMPPVSFKLNPDFIETSTTAIEVVEARLRASGRNREGGTEYYTDVEPSIANLQPIDRADEFCFEQEDGNGN